MDLKQNINKVHIDLTNSFSQVKISEKFNKNQNYFEILIKEGVKEIKMILDKTQIQNSNFQWSYFSNTFNESSTLIERRSDINSLVSHVKDIFEKNRFDEDYIKMFESESEFKKDNFINKKITNILSLDNEIKIQTGETSFSIGCGGGATAEMYGDDLINDIISNITIEEYTITINSQSGKTLEIGDDTGGEGVEIW